MSVYLFSRLMQAYQWQLQGLRAQQYVNTASERNAGDDLMCRTVGNATLSDSFVAPQKQGLTLGFFVASRTQSKVAVFNCENKAY